MSGAVSWNLEMNVQEGRLEEVRPLMEEMIEATKQEPGTVGYEWFLSSDGSTCHLHESYADSDAAMEHLANFGANFAERFMSCFAPTAFYVYGEPSEQVRSALDGLGATYLGALGGFTR